MEEKLETIDERFRSIDQRFEAIDQRFESMEKRFDRRFDTMERRFDQRFKDIQSFLLWGFGVLFSFMTILMGFILWDRRTVVKPIESKQNHPDLKIILDKAAML